MNRTVIKLSHFLQAQQNNQQVKCTVVLYFPALSSLSNIKQLHPPATLKRSKGQLSKVK